MLKLFLPFFTKQTPCLFLKGIYHHWTYFHLFHGAANGSYRNGLSYSPKTGLVQFGHQTPLLDRSIQLPGLGGLSCFVEHKNALSKRDLVFLQPHTCSSSPTFLPFGFWAQQNELGGQAIVRSPRFSAHLFGFRAQKTLTRPPDAFPLPPVVPFSSNRLGGGFY